MTNDKIEKEARDYANAWLWNVQDLERAGKKDPKPEYIRIKDAYFDAAIQREKRIAELEKENVELKEKLEIEQNARGDWFGKAVTKDRQLNEAIDIIRMYYLYNPSSDYSYKEIDQKADAFLKEIL